MPPNIPTINARWVEKGVIDHLIVKKRVAHQVYNSQVGQRFKLRLVWSGVHTTVGLW